MADPIKTKLQNILSKPEKISERIDIEKTIANMGERIQQRMQKDDSVRTPKVTEDDVRAFLAKVIEADPTPNQKFSMWIIRMYLNGVIKRFEDLMRVNEPLTIFSKFQKEMPIKDINQIKSLNDLESMVEPFEDKQTGKEEKAGVRKKLIDSGEATLHYNSKNYSIIQPNTKEAAQEFGKDTKWCTSAKNNNAFDDYDNGALYILLHKPSSTRWQIHWETSQYMDSRDDPVNLFKLFTEHPEFLKSPVISDYFGFTNDGGAAYWIKTPAEV